MRINPQQHNTINSLALVYKLSSNYLIELIEPLQFQDLNTRVFTQRQVMLIVEYLGSPDIINDEIDPIALNTNMKLAKHFGVSVKTFKKWIEDVPNLKKDYPFRRKYLPKEVQMIVYFLNN